MLIKLKAHIIIVCIALLSASRLLAGPEIVCEAPVHNFGTVLAPESVSHRFILWNRGDRLVEIAELKSCCGVQLSISAMEILPGSNAVCTAVFATRNRYGRQVKSFTVSSNAENQPELELQLQGDFLRAVAYTPRIVRFTAGTIGNHDAQLVTITNLLDTAVELHSVSTRIQGLEVSVKESHARYWVVQLKPRPDARADHMRGNVELVFSFGTVNIPVLSVAQSAFRIIPEQVVYTDASEAGKVRLVNILSRDRQPFRIVSITLENMVGEVDSREINDGRWQLRLMIDPTRIKPDSALKITTDSVDQPLIVVPIRRSIEDITE